MAKTRTVHPKINCISHHPIPKELSETNFYIASEASMFGGVGRIMMCKECCKKIYQNYYSETKDIKVSIYKTCRRMDIAFINSIYEGAISSSGGDWSKVFGRYITQYNSLGLKNGWQYNFDHSEDINITSKETAEDKEELENSTRLTSEEKRIRKQIIKMLESDPFEGYAISDQKFLYPNLLKYINEDIIEDAYKVSAIIQLCNNNNQLKKYHIQISQFSSDAVTLMKNTDKIKSLDVLVKSLVDNNKKIAEDNGISEKHKKGSTSGANTLSNLLVTLREYGFKHALENHLSQKMTDSYRRISKINHENIFRQLMLDETDQAEIIATQRTMIKKMEEELNKKREEVRKLYEEKGENNG